MLAGTQGRQDYLLSLAGCILTVHVINDVRILALVVMDQLDDVHQVILVQLADSIRHLFHIEGLLLLAAVLRLAGLPILVRRQRTRLAQDGLQSLGRVFELDRVDILIRRVGKVQVMNDCLLAALLRGVTVNRHLKLAPTLIGALERWLMKCCA